MTFVHNNFRSIIYNYNLQMTKFEHPLFILHASVNKIVHSLEFMRWRQERRAQREEGAFGPTIQQMRRPGMRQALVNPSSITTSGSFLHAASSASNHVLQRRPSLVCGRSKCGSIKFIITHLRRWTDANYVVVRRTGSVFTSSMNCAALTCPRREVFLSAPKASNVVPQNKGSQVKHLTQY